VSPADSLVKPPAAWLHPANIRYLAFKGGGGKGVAFTGSLGWLEEHLAPLPIKAGSKMLGVSGASAGAITAFLVALGYKATELRATFESMQLTALVDKPQYGRVRCVTRSTDTLELAGPVEKAAAWLAARGWNESMADLDLILRLAGSVSKGSLPDMLLSTDGYLQCLIGDSGMMAGTAIRNWLGNQLVSSPWFSGVTSPNRWQLPHDPTKITFDQLFGFGSWKVQLAVVASNLTTGRPMVFSQRTTPSFPVVDAVAMSASFPGLFKPTWVGTTAPFGNNIDSKHFVGWYADGGIINNLPIHVFDSYPPKLAADPYFDTNQLPLSPPATLNEYMLGILLEEGDPPIASSKQLAPYVEDPKKTQDLFTTLKQVENALEFNSNMGQLRSRGEYLQVVMAYTGKIRLPDFAPKSEDIRTAYNYSYQQMDQFYRGRADLRSSCSGGNLDAEG
jgi:predicted acylesterase/phospholipase RssA